MMIGTPVPRRRPREPKELYITEKPLPSNFEADLETLLIQDTDSKDVPAFPPALRELLIENAPNIETLPPFPSSLKHLRILNLPALRELPLFPPKLRSIQLGLLPRIEDVSSLSSGILNLYDMERLKLIPDPLVVKTHFRDCPALLLPPVDFPRHWSTDDYEETQEKSYNTIALYQEYMAKWEEYYSRKRAMERTELIRYELVDTVFHPDRIGALMQKYGIGNLHEFL